MEVFIRVNF